MTPRSASSQVTSPAKPSSSWRFQSFVTIAIVNRICDIFLHRFNETKVTGHEAFVDLLRRRDEGARKRGLVTVSNHVSVIDDPLIWGALAPYYKIHPWNHRWSLGSYDICFKNRVLSSFFSHGKVLPTHRSMHSPHGGLFQPTMTQAIRLLSAQPFVQEEVRPKGSLSSTSSYDIPDPFSSNALTYTTNGRDRFLAPSAYSDWAYSWVHIFPEGRIHQHPHKTLRYFKWGVSRLILESEPLPDIVPMFIDGTQYVMHESRTFPRFLPRIRKDIHIAFGEPLNGEQVFGDLRRRWQVLVEQHQQARARRGLPSPGMAMGELPDDLKYADEAVSIRKEVTDRIRLEVLKVRRSLGHADEDPKNGLVETWIEEGPKKTGEMKDGSWVGET